METNCIFLWQLPSPSFGRNMSYVIEYKNKVIIIDGGDTDDGEYLYNFIAGRAVEAWFITHPHYDHISALLYILQNKNVTINKVYYPTTRTDWIETGMNFHSEVLQTSFFNLLTSKNIPKIIVDEDNIITIEDLTFKILGSINYTSVDMTSPNTWGMIILIIYGENKILFLADAFCFAFAELLQRHSDDLKNINILQMGHHGESDISNSQYSNINPDICLWPTPVSRKNLFTTVYDNYTYFFNKTHLFMFDGLRGIKLFQNKTYEILKGKTTKILVNSSTNKVISWAGGNTSNLSGVTEYDVFLDRLNVSLLEGAYFEGGKIIKK